MEMDILTTAVQLCTGLSNQNSWPSTDIYPDQKEKNMIDYMYSLTANYPIKMHEHFISTIWKSFEEEKI